VKMIDNRLLHLCKCTKSHLHAFLLEKFYGAQRQINDSQAMKPGVSVYLFCVQNARKSTDEHL
jgi:hypothetical protein